MYIEKIKFAGSDLFGNVTVRLSKRSKGDSESSKVSNSTIYFKHAEDDANVYTFIIGDNGVGKTNLLNSIAGISRNHLTRVNTKQQTLKKVSIKYIGSGLYSRDIEMEDANVKIVNPNKVSVSGMLCRLYYDHPDKIDDLQKVLNKNILPEFAVTPSYNITQTTGKVYFGASRDIYTYSFIDFLSLGDWTNQNYEYLEIALRGSSFYDVLVKRYGDDLTSILCAILQSQIVKNYRILIGKANYNPKYHNFDSPSKVVLKKMLNTTLYNGDIHNLNEKDDHLIMLLLEELGLIHINMYISNQIGKFPVSSLSTGEKIMIKTFTYFADLSKEQVADLIFMYDEPENSLHPKWQQQFPSIIQYIAENIYNIKNSHFIFTTHSPLLVMHSLDLPNSNIVSFSRDENDKFQTKLLEDVKQFNIEALMFEQFGLSYYNSVKEEEIRKELGDRAAEIFRENQNVDRLSIVSEIADLNRRIQESYKIQ